MGLVGIRVDVDGIRTSCLRFVYSIEASTCARGEHTIVFGHFLPHNLTNKRKKRHSIQPRILAQSSQLSPYNLLTFLIEDTYKKAIDC